MSVYTAVSLLWLCEASLNGFERRELSEANLDVVYIIYNILICQ